MPPKPFTRPPASAPLVYDADRGGHRDRGVFVLARVVDGTAWQAPPMRGFGRLVGNRSPLLWQTADYVLSALILVCLARSLLMRRTVALCYRNDISGGNSSWRGIVRKFAIDILRHLPFVTVLRIFPPILDSAPTTDWIYDPEWWDLAVSPVEYVQPIPPKSEHPTILFIGNVHWLKGVDFFIEAARAAALAGCPLKFRLVGAASRLTPSQRQVLDAAGVEIFDETPSDGQFLGYIRGADFLWCCYHPDYDQSSGIFGRALQLGIPTVVRRGSLLDGYMDAYGGGLAVDYGDTAALLATLPGCVGTKPPPSPSHAMWSLSRGRLRSACGLA